MPFLEFVAGSISGALGIAFGYPFDTVKVRLQAQTLYRGIFNCVVQTYTHEGIHGFYKGMLFPLVSTGFSNSIVFGCYSNSLDYLTQSQRSRRSQGQPPSLVHVFNAGCVAGLVQVCLMAPIELVKVRMQGQATTSKYHGSFHCVATILKEAGPGRLFCGWQAHMLRDVPCYGLYFWAYEVTCNALTERGRQPDTFTILLAGGVAGVASWGCATPMDVVKARLQLSGAGGPTYRGFLDCILVSFREEGVRVFFKGLMLNSIRAFPVNALTFLSYEYLMRLFYPVDS
ncbi:solute carrier family 25 member 45 [Synchiropus splendidus]|uniref:solute carrier family 25 member 45 n=1 Tax=Synchiropus splendidus TaxID=270530 RepID=UPI00237E22A1|nr:solute carrier family 25 member 45 [Synchiropus splendidus]